jgi:hypothetical protein
MTAIVDSPPSADQVDALLSSLEDQWFDDTDWVDAEFNAIIAGYWDTTTPQPPGPPTALPARWNQPHGPRQQRSRQRLAGQVMADSHHRRQRSPPTL